MTEKSGKSMEHWIFREQYRTNWTRGVLWMIDRNGHCTLDGPIEWATVFSDKQPR